MQEISRGKKCLLSINIAKVGAVQNAVKIDTHIISPSGVVSCVANGYDELKKVVALIISGEVLNELGAYSIDLRLVFADSVIIVPTFAFAEVVEGVEPCYGVSEVYVSIEGGEVVPSGNTTTIEFVSREEFERLSKDIAEKVDKVEGKGLSTNDFTNEYKQKVDELSGGGGGGGSITIDKELSPTSDNAIANSAVVQGLAGLAEGVSEAIGNVTKNVEQNTADIKTKQNTLTLTTKPNGNIVIGNLAGQSKEFMPATPSGDPMHYMYEAVGAVYNDIGTDTTFIGVYGDTLVHKANHWRLNDLGDLTKKEMADIYREAHLSLKPTGLSWWWANSKQRTNICVSSSATASVAIEYAIYYSTTILTATFGDARPDKVANLTRGCSSLKSIIGVLDWSLVHTCTTPFSYSSSLQNVRIKGMKVNISFADSPLLSKESLLYMINNCASNVSFTITLHPDVYAKCTDADNGEWYDDVENAIDTVKTSKGTTITLASA